MKYLLFFPGTKDLHTALGLLFLRITIACMMLFGHGLIKLQNFNTMKDDWYVPKLWPFHYLNAPLSLIGTLAAEVLASALIILGFMTRPAAFLFAFTMIIAAFEVHASHAFFISKANSTAKELPVLYAVVAIALLITGAGKFSLDSLIYKEPKRRRY